MGVREVSEGEGGGREWQKGEGRGWDYRSEIVSCGAIAAAVMSSSDSSESGRGRECVSEVSCHDVRVRELFCRIGKGT